MLRTQSLCFQYTPEVSFSFPDILLGKGEQLAVLGESGVGKTTLLHLLSGLLSPQSGNIWINDTLFSALSPTQADRFRGQHIGIIFQRPYFMEALSLVENLMLVQKVSGKKPSRDFCLGRLEELGLQHRADNLPAALSQGERQRGAIAMATINQPPILLADEPTSSLDDKNCSRVLDLLLAQATQASLLLITHDARVKSLLPAIEI